MSFYNLIKHLKDAGHLVAPGSRSPDKSGTQASTALHRLVRGKSGRAPVRGTHLDGLCHLPGAVKMQGESSSAHTRLLSDLWPLDSGSHVGSNRAQQ